MEQTAAPTFKFYPEKKIVLNQTIDENYMSYAISKINELPTIASVKATSKALALLDAILMPEWENRFFSFNSEWDISKNEMTASMRDGSGNEYFLLFSEHGVAGKVFFEEEMENASNLLRAIPECFDSFKNEPAFNFPSTTYCFWRKEIDDNWSVIPQEYPSYSLLAFLAGGYSEYHRWAEAYYERAIDIDVLKTVFETCKISENQLIILNPELSIDDLDSDLVEIFGNQQ